MTKAIYVKAMVSYSLDGVTISNETYLSNYIVMKFTCLLILKIHGIEEYGNTSDCTHDKEKVITYKNKQTINVYIIS
jgi:hypothetical protein